MLAIRIAMNDPARSSQREMFIEDHKTHLRSGRIKIVRSGPIADDAGRGCGGIVVASVASMDEMQTFSGHDPFVIHGVYASVEIYEWQPTIGDE